MALRDHRFDHRRKVVRLNAYEGAGIQSNGTGTVSVCVGAGDVVTAELNAAGFIVPAPDTAADEIGFIWLVPYDVDERYELGFRVLWSSDNTGTTDTATWKINWAHFGEGEAIAAPTGVLSTVIAADTVTGQYHFQKTARGVLTAASHAITRANVEDGSALCMLVELDAKTTGLSNAYFLGLELDYCPRMMKGNGVLTDPNDRT